MAVLISPKLASAYSGSGRGFLNPLSLIPLTGSGRGIRYDQRVLHLIRRFFLIVGALALVQPSIAAAALACPMTEAYGASRVRQDAEHGQAHERMVGARPDGDVSNRARWQATSDASSTPCEHRCPDARTCVAGASCSSTSPSVVTVKPDGDTERTSLAIDAAIAALPHSRLDAPESPPPRL